MNPIHGYLLLMPVPAGSLRGDISSTSMQPSDVEASDYDLVVTSVRLIRVGNVIQIVFSKKKAAEVFYAEAAARFKREEEGQRY